MRWFLDLKIQHKLILALGLLTLLMTAAALLASRKVTRVGIKYDHVLKTSVAQRHYAAEAIRNMTVIRLTAPSFVHNAHRAPDAVVSDWPNRNSLYAETGFISNIEDYRASVLDDANLPKAAVQERIDRLDIIKDLFVNRYLPSIGEFERAVAVADQQGVNDSALAVNAIGDDIAARLRELCDIASAAVEQDANDMTDSVGNAINSMFVELGGIMLVMVFLLLYTGSTIKRPISKLVSAMAEISAGNFSAPIRIDQKDELGMFSNHLASMLDNIVEMNKQTIAMDRLDTMICVTDLNHNMIYINRSLAETYGLDIQNYQGKKCYNFIRKQDQPCAFCCLPDILPAKDAFPTHRSEYSWDDISNLWISRHMSIIRWIDGSQVYFQVIHDVSDKKMYEAKLEEAVKTAEEASVAKSVFLANMSHELRTPLNAVVGLSDLMLEDKRRLDSDNNLEKIHDAGVILLNIVNDVLDLSKIEAGRLSLAPAEYGLAHLLNDTIALNIVRKRGKPISFRLDISHDLPSRLRGDELRIRQVLNNLLSNAFKYTNAGSVTMSVRSEPADDGTVILKFVVADTGIGIREEDQEKLFVEYFKAQNYAAGAEVVEGTGLGLVITRDLVRLMGGDIVMKSESGKGSTFTATIRQAVVDATPIDPVTVKALCTHRYHDTNRRVTTRIARVDLSYARVLVVDDMMANLDVATGILRKYNICVDTLMRGHDAVERIRFGEPVYDAIFMDHMMPGMDGVETVRAIRALGTEYARNVPVVALTANAIVGMEAFFLENGFQAFLSKPIDKLKLDAVLRTWVMDEFREAPMASGPEITENGVAAPPRIPGVDTEAGLALYEGDVECYLTVIRSFVSDTRRVIDRLRRVSAESLPDFAAAAHAIKGVSATIGAKTLHEKAARLEAMAKAGDLFGVEERCGAFVRDLESLVDGIQSWVEARDSRNPKPRLVAPDRAVLAALQEGCETYDIDSINAVMEKLEESEYDEGGDLVAWLRERVYSLDLSSIAKRLDFDGCAKDEQKAG